MPRVTTILFTGSILIVMLCQSFVQQGNFKLAMSDNDLIFAPIFLFCAAGILTSWLGKPVKEKPEDDSDSSDNDNKKPPRDTAL
ncbi:MAG TPA: hypothetical protein VIR78_14325 [Malonomonas sp.]